MIGWLEYSNDTLRCTKDISSNMLCNDIAECVEIYEQKWYLTAPRCAAHIMLLVDEPNTPVNTMIRSTMHGVTEAQVVLLLKEWIQKAIEWNTPREQGFLDSIAECNYFMLKNIKQHIESSVAEQYILGVLPAYNPNFHANNGILEWKESHTLRCSHCMTNAKWVRTHVLDWWRFHPVCALCAEEMSLLIPLGFTRTNAIFLHSGDTDGQRDIIAARQIAQLIQRWAALIRSDITIKGEDYLSCDAQNVGQLYKFAQSPEATTIILKMLPTQLPRL